MIRIAIVEDETVYVQQLQEHLEKYQKETGEAFRISIFSDGDEIVNGYRAEYDLIFLDVQMTFMDGLTAAEHIRELDQDVMIIFITNMAQYAIRGYTVNALDFMLKPVSYFAFSQRLKRALEQLKRRAKKYINLKVDGGIARIALDQIYYIESMKHRIIVHGSDGDYSLAGTMKEMERQLSEDNFYRCNNCYLVNLAQVESVRDGFVYTRGGQLQISRPKRKAFMEALTDYMGGVIG